MPSTPPALVLPSLHNDHHNDHGNDHQNEAAKEQRHDKHAVFKVVHLAAADYARMPWKNGNGSTEEIAIHPHSARFPSDPFVWRLSSARIDRSCLFSAFPGFYSTIVLLKKEGMGKMLKLRMDDGQVHTVHPLSPFTFDAAHPPHCDITVPSQDVTLLVHRSHSCSISVESVDADRVYRKVLVADTTLVYVVDGRIRLSMEKCPSVTAAAHETVMVEKSTESSPTDLKIVSLDDHDSATFLLIQIDPKPEKPLVGVSSEALHKAANSAEAIRSSRKGSVIAYSDVPATPLVLPPQTVQTSTNESSQLDANPLPSTPLLVYQPPVSQRPLTSDVLSPTFPYIPSPTDRPDQAAVISKDIAEDAVPSWDELDLDKCPRGKITRAWIKLLVTSMSEWIRVPVIVARGMETKSPVDDIVLGLTAALHGNEVNGVNCIHRVMADVDVSQLQGTVVAVPCVNGPGFVRHQREFSDGKDLNRLFPGHLNGQSSSLFAYYFTHKILSHLNYLVDLHTASFGRVNSYYVRADLNDGMVNKMARCMCPQILLHNSGQDGTLRSAAMERGIKSITVEIGNPQLFQPQFIQWTHRGIFNIMEVLEMYHHPHSQIKEMSSYFDSTSLDEKPGIFTRGMSFTNAPLLPPPPIPTICARGFWTYTTEGGLLEVYPPVNTFVKRGMVVARVRSVFGSVVGEYCAPCDAMVIGKSSNPVAMMGDRVVHFGVPMRDGEELPRVAKENY